jgi:glycosyl transferase family 25
MQVEAERAGIKLSFVQAVDGRSLNLDEVPGYDREGRLRHAPDLKPNEVACVLSHKAALETFLASGAKAAVVLEDDAVLSDCLAPFVEAMVRLPIAWNAVNLENWNHKPLRPALITFDFGVGLHASAWLSAGAAGWLYSRDGAARILCSLQSFRHAYDTHIGFFWRHGISALCVHPPLVRQAGVTPSTIATPDQPVRTVPLEELTFTQFLRTRRERLEHEFRKEIEARLTFIRLKIALARSGRLAAAG